MARLAKKDWRHVVELSAGMTGADLEKLRRELAYDLLRLGRARATRDDIVEHINVIKYGIRDTRERTREELEHIAWHEAGHIVLSQLLNPDVAIRNASITGRGNAAGFVEFDGEAHRNRRMTRKEVKEDLIILMGGRAAQVIKFGEDGIDAGVPTIWPRRENWCGGGLRIGEWKWSVLPRLKSMLGSGWPVRRSKRAGFLRTTAKDL